MNKTKHAKAGASKNQDTTTSHTVKRGNIGPNDVDPHVSLIFSAENVEQFLVPDPPPQNVYSEVWFDPDIIDDATTP